MSESPERAVNALPPCAAVVLAAGRSTRMKSDVPKPLHPVCGVALTRHVVDACKSAGVERVIVVVGHMADQVRQGLGSDIEYAVQDEPLGSGHATLAAEPLLREYTGSVLVLAGDIPLLCSETLSTLVSHHHARGASATLLTAIMDDAHHYGRIVRDPDGSIARIVEHRDATPEELEIREWNPSIYCFHTPSLFPALRGLSASNAQGEYYLTDVIGAIGASGGRVESISTRQTAEVLGVNNRVQLAAVAAIMRERVLTELMMNGVTIVDPTSTYVDVGVTVGRDTVIEPQTILRGKTAVGARCTVGPFTQITDCEIGDDAQVVATHAVGSSFGSRVRVGPFANIRPGCRVGDGVKVGDFVELKNTVLGDGVSAGHMAYLGDTDVGAGTNIGAGTITCNYDGKAKHRTVIGSGAFVGSHATLVAPVTLGDGAYIAAASAICDDVPADALAIAREKQVNKPEWAARRRRGSEGTE